MATPAESETLVELKAARADAVARLRELLARQTPDASLDGEQFQLGQEKERLVRLIKDLTAQIVAMEPFELVSQAFP